MASSNIEWCDDVWNPTVGCTKVSAGCRRCYAETMHARLTAMGQPKYAEPFTVVKPYPAHLDVPLRARKPRRYFVNSMSDLFHEDVPDEYIAAVFGVMAAAPQHTFQVLTKRAERMADWLKWIVPNEQDVIGCHLDEYLIRAGHGVAERWRLIREKQHDAPRPWAWPLSNVWLGVSVENQEQADARIPHLLKVPAAVRFLSCEPLLAAIDLTPYLPTVLAPGNEWRPCVCAEIDPSDRPCVVCAARAGVSWVIAGGESGHGARPCALEWIGRIVEQCRGAGVPVFVKQLGACVVSEFRTAPKEAFASPDRFLSQHFAPNGEVWAWRAGLVDKKGGDPSEWPEDLRVREWPSVRS